MACILSLHLQYIGCSPQREAIAVMKYIIHCVRVDNSALGQPLTPPTATSSLAVPMMLLCLVDQLETAAPSMDADMDVDFTELADWCVREVMKHIHRSGNVVLETVGTDGEELDGSQGRLMNPGNPTLIDMHIYLTYMRNFNKSKITMPCREENR